MFYTTGKGKREEEKKKVKTLEIEIAHRSPERGCLRASYSTLIY